MTNEPASSPAPSMDSAAAPEAAGELTPETLNMLEEAISAILDKIGDNPKYAELGEHLQMAQAEASQLDGGGDEGDQPDPYSFDEAQANMTARRAGA